MVYPVDVRTEPSKKRAYLKKRYGVTRARKEAAGLKSVTVWVPIAMVDELHAVVKLMVEDHKKQTGAKLEADEYPTQED